MPARYSPEPRYDLLIDHFYRTPSVLIIIPTGLDFAPHFSMRVQKRGVRLAHAHALAQEQAARGSVTIVDCSDDPDPGYQALLAAEKHAEQMYTEREQREREPLERAIADVPEDEYEDESVSPF